MPKPFYITTAIDYTNAAPHVGHAYEKVLADVIARYHRLKGEDVFFLTGVDQHGQKVQQAAQKQGVSPEQFVAEMTPKFRGPWDKLDVRYDRWAETTDPLHKTCVQKILQRLFDEGQLYKAKQAGHYSVRQEQFLTEKERGADGEFGPEWGQVEFREEENYYFRLAEHKDWLLGLIDRRDDFITPAFRRGELRNAVEKLSGDLCISRPKSRLSWGIEFPFDSNFVTYVWFDALVNYISFAGYDPEVLDFNLQPSAFREKWPALHVIGKDIMIPAHGIYWPIMLHALKFTDEEIPRLLVHGWWNIAGAKMSKSEGNVVDPNVLTDKYGVDALRYYLVSDIVTGKDSDFSEERLIERYNTDLANSLGNLLNRALNMTARYSNGSVWQPSHRVDFEESGDTAKINVREGELSGIGHTLVANQWSNSQAGRHYIREMDVHSVSIAFERVQNSLSLLNGLIERLSPWKLAKANASDPDLRYLLYHLAESLRIIAILISPVTPKAAHGIFDQLNWKKEPELAGKEARFSLADAEWGKLPDGHVVGKPTPLFPRIERNTGIPA